MRLRPVTRSALVRFAGWVVALIGALSLAVVGGVLSGVWGTVVDAPLAAIGLVVGLLLLLYAYRDPLLAHFGVVRPEQFDRQVRDWLTDQGYTITPKPAAHIHFGYEVRDALGNGPYTVAMAKESKIAGVEIAGRVAFSPQHAESMKHATPADRRDIRERLISTALLSDRLNVVGFEQDLSTTVTAFVVVEEWDFRSFLEAIHAVRRAIATAAFILGSAAERIQDRVDGTSTDPEVNESTVIVLPTEATTSEPPSGT